MYRLFCKKLILLLYGLCLIMTCFSCCSVSWIFLFGAIWIVELNALLFYSYTFDLLDSLDKCFCLCFCLLGLCRYRILAFLLLQFPFLPFFLRLPFGYAELYTLLFISPTKFNFIFNPIHSPDKLKTHHGYPQQPLVSSRLGRSQSRT